MTQQPVGTSEYTSGSGRHEHAKRPAHAQDDDHPILQQLRPDEQREASRDVHIHERLGIRLPQTPYLDWVRESHALHHRYGGEPYGMLLPVVPRALRARAASTRAARMRL